MRLLLGENLYFILYEGLKIISKLNYCKTEFFQISANFTAPVWPEEINWLFFRPFSAL